MSRLLLRRKAARATGEPAPLRRREVHVANALVRPVGAFATAILAAGSVSRKDFLF